jgi:hypothetical protein
MLQLIRIRFLDDTRALTGGLSHGFAIQIIPEERTNERFDYNESWQNSYMARPAFVFNLR